MLVQNLDFIQLDSGAASTTFGQVILQTQQSQKKKQTNCYTLVVLPPRLSFVARYPPIAIPTTVDMVRNVPSSRPVSGTPILGEGGWGNGIVRGILGYDQSHAALHTAIHRTNQEILVPDWLITSHVT
eukprot:sb/3475328/